MFIHDLKNNKKKKTKNNTSKNQKTTPPRNIGNVIPAQAKQK